MAIKKKKRRTELFHTRLLCVVVPKFEPGISEEGSYAINPDDHLGGLFAPSNRRITRKGSRKGRKSKDSAAQVEMGL